jgi:hypothetical protein
MAKGTKKVQKGYKIGWEIFRFNIIIVPFYHNIHFNTFIITYVDTFTVAYIVFITVILLELITEWKFQPLFSTYGSIEPLKNSVFSYTS